MNTIYGDFDLDGGATDQATQSDSMEVDNTAKPDDTLSPGEVYMINLKVETDANDAGSLASIECAPTIGEEHTLIISVEGGGTTYETLSYTSITEGDSVV